jgi:uncharacterized protein CbrC (UPF0167 family)
MPKINPITHFIKLGSYVEDNSPKRFPKMKCEKCNQISVLTFNPLIAHKELNNWLCPFCGKKRKLE